MIKITPAFGADTPEEAAAKFLEAAEVVRPAGGMQETIWTGIVATQAFIVENIEVDTGRARNSITGLISQNGSVVEGAIFGQTSYIEYVRDASHSRPFLEYAEDRFVPELLAMLGEDIIVKVENVFNK